MDSQPLSPSRTIVVPDAVRETIAARYAESRASLYQIGMEQFLEVAAAVVLRYAGDAGVADQVALAGLLRVEDLVLARACSAGNDRAWETFLSRFRAPLYDAAARIATNEATARELADELYADLYGCADAAGRKISKLDLFMGRGSLEGWLRAVLAQRYVDRCRRYAKTVSLEEQMEAGARFAAPSPAADRGPDPRLAAAVQSALGELTAEERFLLVSWYLDGRTLAEIGAQLRVHDSTISRRLGRTMTGLRKRIRKRLREGGIASRACDEMLADLDVRDLDVDVAANLRQESLPGSFYKKDRPTT